VADSTSRLSVSRRRLLQTSAGALGAAGTVGLYAPAVIGQAKPLDGVTLNVSCWSAPYPKWLAEYIPEFEDMTGAKVNYDTPGFPIYNQQVDLELSTGGSAFDVLCFVVPRQKLSGSGHALPCSK
jgi:multiple sugar transport system substrate-binding protein